MNFSIRDIFQINDEDSFNNIALKLFYYQYSNNNIYRKYVDLIIPKKRKIHSVKQIPFLPIKFFRNHKIITRPPKNKSIDSSIKKFFISSGTTSSVRSFHYLIDISIYKKSLLNSFKYFYENIEQYCILALIPPYEENQNSSLSFMVNEFIKSSNNKYSGFYLHNTDVLNSLLSTRISSKTILIGLSFALLDFTEKYKCNNINEDLIVIETGGMKSRRKEITREELHKILCSAFNVKNIHSEYGMTELLSQAYSKGKSIFYTPPWMKVFIRDINDPLNIISKANATGAINIIDLANINSCAFIATDDIGRIHNDGGFEVLGRLDSADIKGCSLM